MAQILSPIPPRRESDSFLTQSASHLFYGELLKDILGIKLTTRGEKTNKQTKQNMKIMNVAHQRGRPLIWDLLLLLLLHSGGFQMSDSVDVTSAASRQTSCVLFLFCLRVVPVWAVGETDLKSRSSPPRRPPDDAGLDARCFYSIFIIIVITALRVNLLMRSKHPITEPQPAGVDKRLCHSVM